MGATLVGVVNSARVIADPNGAYNFYALDLITERGTTAACQVWNNDPTYQKLIDTGEQLVNHKVKVSITNYNIGWRELKKGGEKVPQIRFRVTNVRDLGIPANESALIGIVESGRAITAQDGSYNFVAMDITTHRGTKYACQIWDSDPEYFRVGPVVEQLISHKVKVAVLSMNVGMRKQKDGTQQPQARFRITGVEDLGIPQDEED